MNEVEHERELKRNRNNFMGVMSETETENNSQKTEYKIRWKSGAQKIQKYIV